MEYKEWILRFIEQIGDDDTVFLIQIYTLLKRHIERATGRCGR